MLSWDHIDWWSALYTIIIGILIIVIYVLTVVILSRSELLPLSKKDPETLLPGTILSVRYNTSLRANIIQIFTGSGWSHIALVIKHENKNYVAESAFYSEKCRGTVITPIEKWIKYNSSRPIAFREPLESNDKILPLLRNSYRSDINLNILTWWKSMISLPYKDNRNLSSYYCSEFVATLLQETGVLEKSKHAKSYKPYELIVGKMPFYREPKCLEKIE